MEYQTLNQLAMVNIIEKIIRMNIKPSYNTVHKTLIRFSNKLSPDCY
jgi:hypothetical protein